MTKTLSEAFEQYEDIFVARAEEIREYLLKYKMDAFQQRDIIDIERIDATDRLKTSGFRKSLSMWQNFYKNIIVSSCVKLKGKEKRYDYKFYFVEEKLSPELLEKVERTINNVTKLKQRRKFGEALDKVNRTMEKVSDENDQYINERLTELREDVRKAQEEYNQTLQHIKDLETRLEKMRDQQNYNEALKVIEEILEVSKSIEHRETQRKYKEAPQQLKREKIRYLQQMVDSQRKNGEFEAALKNCNEIIQLTEEIGLEEIKEDALKIIGGINNEIEEIRERERIKERIATLGQSLMREREEGNYKKALHISKEIIELSEIIGDKNIIDKYSQIREDIQTKIRELEQKREKENRIFELERQIEQKRESGDWEAIIELSSEIIKLSSDIGREEIRNEYQGLIKEVEIQIKERNRRREIETKITSLKRSLTREREVGNYEKALETSSNIIELAESVDDRDTVEHYYQIKNELQAKLEEIRQERYRREIEGKIKDLGDQIREKRELGDLEGILDLSNEIIDLSTEIERNDIKGEYQKILEETNQKIEQQQLKEQRLGEFHHKTEEERNKREKKAEHLLNKVKKFESMIKIEKGVLPIVEEWSANELLGDISNDPEVRIDQLNTLLEEHRVEIGQSIESESRLFSTSGETAILHNDLEIEEDKRKKGPSFSIELGFNNPFDDMVEEAVVSDLIPYNYEIIDIKLNEKKPHPSPMKIKGEHGLEIIWHLQDIPPHEGVEINYALRKRVSRTIIFLLEDQLNIIKTHSNLIDFEADLEGLFETCLSFSHSYEKALNGLVIEDIIPPFYIYEIKEPTFILPREYESDHGMILQWNIGELEPTTLKYRYILLERDKFEELKSSILQLDKEGFTALKNKDVKKSTEKYNQILTTLKDYI